MGYGRERARLEEEPPQEEPPAQEAEQDPIYQAPHEAFERADRGWALRA